MASATAAQTQQARSTRQKYGGERRDARELRNSCDDAIAAANVNAATIAMPATRTLSAIPWDERRHRDTRDAASATGCTDTTCAANTTGAAAALKTAGEALTTGAKRAQLARHTLRSHDVRK